MLLTFAFPELLTVIVQSPVAFGHRRRSGVFVIERAGLGRATVPAVRSSSNPSCRCPAVRAHLKFVGLNPGALKNCEKFGIRNRTYPLIPAGFGQPPVGSYAL